MTHIALILDDISSRFRWRKRCGISPITQAAQTMADNKSAGRRPYRPSCKGSLNHVPLLGSACRIVCSSQRQVPT